MREKLLGGEPRVLQDGGAYSEFCCDCELSHFFTVDINYKKKEVTICYFRDDYKTEKYRKKNDIVIYQRKKKYPKSNTLDKEEECKMEDIIEDAREDLNYPIPPRISKEEPKRGKKQEFQALKKKK